jgi:hypothetical protein
MKFLKIKDCEITDPPSTCFVVLLETESDKAFMAELVDLPTANRAVPALQAANCAESMIEKVVTAGRTSRISVQSFGDHVSESPSTSEEYYKSTLQACEEAFGCDSETLLKWAFLLRTFWF